MKGTKKSTVKGLLQLILVLLVIGGLTVVTLVGIGNQHKGSAKNIKLGLDLDGGVSITYQAVKENPTDTEMEDAKAKLQKRVEDYNSEAEVYREGDNRINVDIPGEKNADAIFEKLGKAGALEFKDPDGNVILDGSHISSANAQQYTDNSGVTQYVVSLEFNSEGTKLFANATKEFLNKQISIYYDGELISSPTVQSEITNGQAVIEGQSSFQEAKELATTIRIGALPIELKEIRSNVVGAKLGIEALNKSLIAGLIGFVLVLLFMIIVYRIPGVAASVALSLYVVGILLVLNGMNATLTLPGIAGIILSIGMAVDANVIIFTRIKEELAKGKTVRTAIKIGFNKALSAILDGNITTLIAAAVLYFKGSGTIKGFAQTLAVGILLSMFTALVVTKFVLKALYDLGFDSVKFYGVAKETKIRNYVGNFKKYCFLSLTVIIIGFVSMGIYSSKNQDILNFGLDFKGGTSTQVTMPEELNDDLRAKVIDAVAEVTGSTPELSSVKDQNAYLIKTAELGQDTRSKLEQMFVDDFGVNKDEITTESISAAVSDEMKTNAVIAVAIATLCMLVYIWIRFKDINFGSSAVIALLHDVLVVLTVYAVARITVGNTFIACMLTIVGYSINATIVIFDRIRENNKGIKTKERLAEVVNTSISQTFTRSINTSLTTFIMVFVLYIFGVDTLKDFALPLMVGIVCGGYSSICITGTLWYTLKAKFDKNLK